MRRQGLSGEVFAVDGPRSVRRIEARPNGRWALELADGDQVLVGGVVLWGVTRCRQLTTLEPGVVDCDRGRPRLVAGVLPPRHRNLYVVDDRVPLDTPALRDRVLRELVSLMRVQWCMAHALGHVLGRVGVRPRARGPVQGHAAMVRGRIVAPVASRFERFLASLRARS